MARRNKRNPEPASTPAPGPSVASPARYRIREGAPAHWDGRRLIPAGGEIVLPEGTAPGQWLDPITD